MKAGLDESYAACHEVIKKASKSFTLASRFLPAEAQRPTWALYAMFRSLDDLVDGRDDHTLSTAEAWTRLRGWREWFEEGCPPGADLPAIVPAFRETMREFEIPFAVFLDLIRALEWDLDGRSYRTMNELLDYAFGVAGTVGLAMCRVLKPSREGAIGRAVELGVAMQLTNIVRDVGEDLAMGRIYLPLSWMERFEVTREDIEAGIVTPGYVTLVKQMFGVAGRYFDSGNAGIALLPRRVRPGIALASAMYRDLLRSVRLNGYDNLHVRARVSDRRKAGLAARAVSYTPRGDASAIPPWYPRGEVLMARHQVPAPSIAG